VYTPYVIDSVASFEELPPTAADMHDRILRPPRLPWLVATRDRAVVGYCYASHHRERPAYRWSVDSSIYLAATEHGRGTGQALYRQLLPLLRDLGYVRAFAGITLPNDASVRLHEAMGFVPVGVFRGAGFKRGGWHDVGWWQRGLSDPPEQPPEPRVWAEPNLR
jgi:phosphinothricin acetyltransferase